MGCFILNSHAVGRTLFVPITLNNFLEFTANKFQNGTNVNLKSFHPRSQGVKPLFLV